MPTGTTQVHAEKCLEADSGVSDWNDLVERLHLSGNSTGQRRQNFVNEMKNQWCHRLLGWSDMPTGTTQVHTGKCLEADSGISD